MGPGQSTSSPILPAYGERTWHLGGTSTFRTHETEGPAPRPAPKAAPRNRRLRVGHPRHGAPHATAETPPRDGAEGFRKIGNTTVAACPVLVSPGPPETSHFQCTAPSSTEVSRCACKPAICRFLIKMPAPGMVDVAAGDCRQAADNRTPPCSKVALHQMRQPSDSDPLLVGCLPPVVRLRTCRAPLPRGGGRSTTARLEKIGA